MKRVNTDGGREAAGFYERTYNDCVVRAIAIAAEIPYRKVYEELDVLQKWRIYDWNMEFVQKCRRLGIKNAGVQGTGRGDPFRKPPDDGVYKSVSKRYLTGLGWQWVGTRKNRRKGIPRFYLEDLPSKGRLIVQLSYRHMTAIIDKVLYDVPGGVLSQYWVLGYWEKSEELKRREAAQQRFPFAGQPQRTSV